jgi:hypothetical protein
MSQVDNERERKIFKALGRDGWTGLEGSLKEIVRDA